MADYRTTFSLGILNLTNEEAAWLEHQGHPGNHGRIWDIDPDGLGLDHMTFDVTVSTETAEMLARRRKGDAGAAPYGTFAAVGCDEDGDLAQVIEFLRRFLLAFPAREPIAFGFGRAYIDGSWDGFGGGAVYMTPRGVEVMDGRGWLEARVVGTAPPELTPPEWEDVGRLLTWARLRGYNTGDILIKVADYVGRVRAATLADPS